MSFFLFVLVPLFDLKCQKRGFLCSKWHFKCQRNANTLASFTDICKARRARYEALSLLQQKKSEARF